jgi:hypothetical protein
VANGLMGCKYGFTITLLISELYCAGIVLIVASIFTGNVTLDFNTETITFNANLELLLETLETNYSADLFLSFLY